MSGASPWMIVAENPATRHNGNAPTVGSGWGADVSTKRPGAAAR